VVLRREVEVGVLLAALDQATLDGGSGAGASAALSIGGALAARDGMGRRLLFAARDEAGCGLRQGGWRRADGELNRGGGFCLSVWGKSTGRGGGGVGGMG
jgi:hypothetical protein